MTTYNELADSYNSTVRDVDRLAHRLATSLPNNPRNGATVNALSFAIVQLEQIIAAIEQTPDPNPTCTRGPDGNCTLLRKPGETCAIHGPYTTP